MIAEKSFSIGTLARATGTKVETVRWYEKVGLLPQPGRSAGNYRSYGEADLGRLSFIRRARELGFSLEQIRNLLGLVGQPDLPCSAVGAIAREHLAEVERKIADLQALRRELDALISQCGCGTVSECRIIEALAPTPDALSAAAGLQ
jgi:DNA-binding transcriptional MerR regulator